VSLPYSCFTAATDGPLLAAFAAALRVAVAQHRARGGRLGWLGWLGQFLELSGFMLHLGALSGARKGRESQLHACTKILAVSYWVLYKPQNPNGGRS
jgi:hypothetical protein